MEVFHVKYDDVILVHKRYMLFRFQVAEAEPGHVHVYFYLPYYEDDGRPSRHERMERGTVEVGEPLHIELEGSDEQDTEVGTVEITVAAVEGDAVTVYVKVPDGWGAIKVDDEANGELRRD
jgi:hypothetical protein